MRTNIGNAQAKKEKARIDLVVSDIVMPRISGPKLIETLRESRPDIPVIYMSGCAREGSLDEDALESGAEILEKPFSPEVLLRLMRGVLDRE